LLIIAAFLVTACMPSIWQCWGIPWSYPMS